MLNTVHSNWPETTNSSAEDVQRNVTVNPSATKSTTEVEWNITVAIANATAINNTIGDIDVGQLVSISTIAGALAMTVVIASITASAYALYTGKYTQ